MKAKEMLDIFMYASRMKNLPRTGWLFTGVKNVESLADHSYNVSFITLILAEYLKNEKSIEINVEKALKLAIIHDLAESIITDIPTPFIKYFGEKEKYEAEKKALEEILIDLPNKEEFIALWEEFENRSSIEGILVRGADKIDMLLELDKYETIGHKGLSGFWASSSKIEEFTKAFKFTDEAGNPSTEPIIEEIYKEILKLRKERMEGTL